MSNEVKRKNPEYAVDFATALPVRDCIERLERDTAPLQRGLGGALAPLRQEMILGDNRTFIVERHFTGALHPIRFVGSLDPDDSGGTWVHGAITHDTANQVLLEGLAVFVVYFLLAVAFFIALKTRGLLLLGPFVLAGLVLFSIRWRALHAATLDLARWVRRKLYVTPEQLKRPR
ncbi:MAG: hypothetical protein GX613_06810 [Chloroflexi bacterium]|nr:hypothetical protein [Chloroflexota bacterium]